MPTLSVIIPSFNGAHRIMNTLDAIKAQTEQPEEVIVVVDGSTDNTAQVLAAYSENYPPLRYIIQENAGRAVTRNVGVKAATSDVFLFFDDDIRPTEHVVARHKAFHATHAHTCLIGSALTQPNRFPGEMGDYLVHIEKIYLQKLESLELHCTPNTLDYLTCGHFSIARSLYEEMGGLDERLRDLEDFDLAMRLHDKGHRIWRDESLTAWHDNVFTPQHFIRRQRQYYDALDVLHRLKPDLMKRRNARKRKPASTWQKIKFWPFAQQFWLSRFGKPPVTWLPRSLRFKIYSLCLYGYVNYYTNKKL